MRTVRESLAYEPVELSFGTSGLRGLASDMTDLECYINTQGFINFVLQTKNIKLGTPIALAGDLRESTPRILSSVLQGIFDAGCKVDYLGSVPTPAAAYYGLTHHMPVVMVTGSHIPADRNGIKFYKSDSEVLKSDESEIKKAVAKVREEIYAQDYQKSIFTARGSLKQSTLLSTPEINAGEFFLNRYTSLFSTKPLQGKEIIVYQHSSIAADLLVKLIQKLGGKAVAVDKATKFIPIDTENVTSKNQAYFKSLAKKYPKNFAIISADGDADRPFVVDENGNFQRGDSLGAVTAEFLRAEFAAVPISASDALDIYLKNLGMKFEHTKIGSPFVIASMNQAVEAGINRVVGWEVNGGFLTASEISIGSGVLLALPTRDAFLPIVCALVAAAQQNIKLSDLFSALPHRFSQAGLLDNFSVKTSRAILEKYSENSLKNRQELEKYFSVNFGFSDIRYINSLDGIRITFDSGDIAHIRPSGNAPQLRIYSVADSQKRANEIVALALAEPGGILRQLEQSVDK